MCKIEGDDDLGQTCILLSHAIVQREINLALWHLNAAQSLSLPLSHLANKPLPYKCNLPGAPGICLIVLQALIPDGIQNMHLNEISPEELTQRESRGQITVSFCIKHLMHAYILKRVPSLPMLLLGLQIFQCEHAKCKH